MASEYHAIWSNTPQAIQSNRISILARSRRWFPQAIDYPLWMASRLIRKMNHRLFSPFNAVNLSPSVLSLRSLCPWVERINLFSPKSNKLLEGWLYDRKSAISVFSGYWKHTSFLTWNLRFSGYRIQDSITKGISGFARPFPDFVYSLNFSAAWW